VIVSRGVPLALDCFPKERLRGSDIPLAGIAKCGPVGGTSGIGQADLMTPDPITYPGYQFPAEIISHAVWLYRVFSLSLRDVELILAERAIVATHGSCHYERMGRIGCEYTRVHVVFADNSSVVLLDSSPATRASSSIRFAQSRPSGVRSTSSARLNTRPSVADAIGCRGFLMSVR
jgi:hypothetical protein